MTKRERERERETGREKNRDGRSHKGHSHSPLHGFVGSVTLRHSTERLRGPFFLSDTLITILSIFSLFTRFTPVVLILSSFSLSFSILLDTSVDLLFRDSNVKKNKSAINDDSSRLIFHGASKGAREPVHRVIESD